MVDVLATIEAARTEVLEQQEYRDSQVKGRVITTLSPVTRQIGYTMPRGAFEVRQVIDGVVTFTQTYDTKLEAADEYAMLRAHGRRNLHEFLESIRPESSYRQQEA